MPTYPDMAIASMGRRAEVKHRIRGGRLSFRFSGHEWTVGDAAEWSEERIERYRRKLLREISDGVWTVPRKEAPAAPMARQDLPTFHEAATDYLASLEKDRNKEVLEWRIVAHLLPFFADYRIDEITRDLVIKYRQRKQTEREQLALARGKRAAGEKLTSHEQALIASGLRGLSNTSVNQTVTTLGSIWEWVAEEHTEAMPRRNPIKGKNMRAAKDPEIRTILNLDQIDAVLQASREHDEQAPKDELRRIGEVMMTLLITGGLRIDELFEARRRDVDLRAGRLSIPDAKTKAGVRAVQLSPYCLTVLKRYMSRALTQGPDDYLFASSRNHSGEPQFESATRIATGTASSHVRCDAPMSCWTSAGTNRSPAIRHTQSAMASHRTAAVVPGPPCKPSGASRAGGA
jgi:integrase